MAEGTLVAESDHDWRLETDGTAIGVTLVGADMVSPSTDSSCVLRRFQESAGPASGRFCPQVGEHISPKLKWKATFHLGLSPTPTVEHTSTATDLRSVYDHLILLSS